MNLASLNRINLALYDDIFLIIYYCGLGVIASPAK
jgi:hypothetical protein